MLVLNSEKSIFSVSLNRASTAPIIKSPQGSFFEERVNGLSATVLVIEVGGFCTENFV